MLINNYTIYSNPNLTPISISLPAQVYVSFTNPLNLKTYFWYNSYGYGLNFSENSGYTFAKVRWNSIMEDIPTLAKVFYVNYSNSYNYGMVATKHLEEMTKGCGGYAGAEAWNNVSGSVQYGWNNPSPYIDLNLSDNTALVYTPMATNYSIGSVQGNPFLIQNSGGLSPLPSAILPKNFYNQTFGSKGNQTIAVNLTFNYSTISKINSNPKTNTIITIFNSIQMPKWFYTIIGVIIMVILVVILYSEKSPIILPIGIILIWIIGIVQFTFYEVALIVSILLLAGYTLKEVR